MAEIIDFPRAEISSRGHPENEPFIAIVIDGNHAFIQLK